jgi:ERCC4-type nuclease
VLLIEHAEVVGWGGNSGGASNKFIACALARFALEGVSVVRTRNKSDTRDFVLWTLERCNNGKIPTFTPEFVFEGGKERKFKKKAYGKPWEVMLTAVRGISKTKAKKLSEKFTNARALLSALEADGDVVKRVGIDGVGKKLCADMREAFIGS